MDQDGQTLCTDPPLFPAETEIEEGNLVFGAVTVEANRCHLKALLKMEFEKNNFTLHFPNLFPYVTILPRVAENSKPRL